MEQRFIIFPLTSNMIEPSLRKKETSVTLTGWKRLNVWASGELFDGVAA
jgi:hypothetical protein